jgi:hypothetical protein
MERHGAAGVAAENERARIVAKGFAATRCEAQYDSVRPSSMNQLPRDSSSVKPG